MYQSSRSASAAEQYLAWVYELSLKHAQKHELLQQTGMRLVRMDRQRLDLLFQRGFICTKEEFFNRPANI